MKQIFLILVLLLSTFETRAEVPVLKPCFVYVSIVKSINVGDVKKIEITIRHDDIEYIAFSNWKDEVIFGIYKNEESDDLRPVLNEIIKKVNKECR